MSVKDLLKTRHDTGKASGGQSTCQTYVAEDWIMSDDIGYSGDDWGCCEDTSTTTSTGSSWMSIASFALGLLALGTAIYAAFAPRNVVESTRQKVQSAATRAATQARELAETTRETIGAGSSSAGSGMGTMSSAPGL
ncbi:MAG: hypothetical protein ABFE08_22795 [Armatimonadia bacterium]